MNKILSRAISFFDTPLSFNEERTQQRLLDRILVLFGFAITVLLIAIITLWLTETSTNPKDSYELFLICISAIPCLIALCALNHSRLSRLARLLFVALLFISALFDTPHQLSDGRGLINFSLSIIAAGILIRPWASFILAFVSSVVIEIAAHSAMPTPQPIPAVSVFFLLATLIWIATRSMERHIKSLSETNASLKESEERYRTLIEISPDMVVLTDLYGRIIVVNQAGLTLFGFTSLNEIQDKRVFDFIAENDRGRAITEFSKMSEQQSPIKAEYCAQTKVGSTFFIELNASVLRDVDGRPEAVLSVGRDVTLRKKTEQAQLAEKDEAYRALVNNSAQGLVLLQNGRIILANAAIASCLGITVEEMYSLPAYKIFEFVHPDDREIGLTRNRDRLEGKPVPDRYETKLVHKNGNIHWLELMPSVITLNNVQTIQITAIDITERKRAEIALSHSESKYRKLHESIRDGFVFVNMDGLILDCNETYQQMLGYSFEELSRITYIDLTPEKWHAFEQKVIEERVLVQGHSDIYEKEYRRKDGSIFPVELHTFLIEDESGANAGMWAIVRDISRRKRIETALRESEERYRTLAEAAQDIIVIVTPDERVEYVNKYAAQLLGMPVEEIIGLPISQFSPTDVNELHRGNLQRVFEQGEPIFTESQMLLPKGEVWLSNCIVPLKDENGITKKILAISRDISEYKRMEAALRQSEERYRSLAEAAHDMIFIVDRADNIQYINQFAAQTIGVAPEEIVGKPRSYFFTENVNKRQYKNIRKVLKQGESAYVENSTAFPSGEKWLSTWLIPLKNESGEVRSILGISRDISERKALEESLIEAKNLLEQRVAERTADLINSHEQLRSLTHTIVLTQENERRRLSRELHDEAGQALIGLTYSLDEVLTETPDELEDVREKIEKVISRVNQLNQHIRGMAHGLRPPILDVAGINLALQGFCRDFSAETHFPVTYSGANDLPALSEETSITLYRIVQEAITNAFRHAHASEAHVSLNHDAACITVTVKDNGAGFDTVKIPKGVGLLGMEERLSLLGGRLEITSRRKHGTRLKATVPLALDLKIAAE